MIKWIAEIGSNHGGSLDRIYKLIDTAKDIGCHATKFQLFRAAQLWHDKQTRTQMQKWELPLDFIPKIAEHCKKREIQLGFSVFYLEAVDILKEHVDFFKIGSYELLWLDLIKTVAKAGKPVILSTGMGTDEEIERAVTIIVNAYEFNFDLILLHCNSSYPAATKDSDLGKIRHLKAFYERYPIGWSDHTRHPGVIYAAIAQGAEVIEFHLDLDGQGWEYQVGHVWLPDEIKTVIDNVRIGEMAYQANEQDLSELRQQRTDVDGMRPMKEVR